MLRLRKYRVLISIGVFLAVGVAVPLQAQATAAQYRIVSSKEIFIFDPSAQVAQMSSVQAYDPVSRTTTLADPNIAPARVQPGSSWWHVVFANDVFQITPTAVPHSKKTGTKYAVGDNVTVTQTGVELQVTSVDDGGAVIGLSIVAVPQSSGYATATGLATTLKQKPGKTETGTGLEVDISTPPKGYWIYYLVGGKQAALQVSLALPKLSIAIGSFGEFIREYWLGNNIALKYNGQFMLEQEDKADQCPALPYQAPWNQVIFQDKSKTKTIRGVLELKTVPLDQVTNPAGLGALHLCLDYALVWRQNSFTIDPASSNAMLAGITVDSSLFPQSPAAPPVQFADSAAFSPQAGPTSKSDAVFYANLQIAAGTGAAGAWGLDGKVAWFDVPFLRGSWTLASATANTGNNTSNITGSTYTDTIDWTLPGSWAHSIWTKKAPTTLTLIASPDYETDREFDRQNFLFSGDTIWTARKLYQPQSYRSKSTDGTMPKYGDPGYASTGYELEFHAGVESGGALIVTTAQNTKKTQSIKVPTYQIERVVPQIHGLFQESIGRFGLLSFDSVLKSRYLFCNENTVRQSASGLLSIKEVSGWKAIETLTSTWNPPKNSNVGLTVTYKDGFDAPKFARVNSVLVGVLIQF